MRTTIDLDYDILTAIKERAQFEGASLGKIASRLIKQALLAPQHANGAIHTPVHTPIERNGIQLLQRKTPPKSPITMAKIQAIADKEGV